MEPASAGPWPKFRGDAQQTGRAPRDLRRKSLPAWTYPALPAHEGGPGRAARGIFNSAVVDEQGITWSGDASGRLSRVEPCGVGSVVGETGGLIDTTPLLLGDALYVASGDGWIWRRAGDGELKPWYQAHPAQKPAFINWFEGHLAVDAAGRIIAPNDNFHVYALQPGPDGPKEPAADVNTYDQTWSLACVDPASGNIWFGNNAMLALSPDARNVFALSRDWKILWTYVTQGSVVASPAFHQGWIYFGSFDGYVYAFDTANPGDPPRPKWTFATGDHLYSSPAVLSDGTIVQAGCDGCVYALHARTGALKWRYDMPLRQPFRSSPAVDPDDNIWLGTGDGHMLVLDARGNRRALHPLGVKGPRLQVNASPAVSPPGMVIGDSEGALHMVPWHVAAGDGASPATAGRASPGDGVGAMLSPTNAWGVLAQELPRELRPGEPLCFTLDAHAIDGLRRERIVGLIDEVHVAPAGKWQARVSGDRRYVIVEQGADLVPGEDAPLRIRATWKHSPQREGLHMWGGEPGPAIEASFSVRIARLAPAQPDPPPMLWYQRIAMSLPSLLPSYNQIGFETLVYGITRVCRLEGDDWLYLCTGWRADGEPDPRTGVRFPMAGRWDARTGTLRLRGDGVHSELNGFATHMRTFALTCWFDAAGRPVGDPVLRISYAPSGVRFYGQMLEALGMGTNDQPIEVFGSGALGVWPARGVPLSRLAWRLEDDGNAIRVQCGSGVQLANSGLALVVQEPGGEPVTMDYAAATQRDDSDGFGLRLVHRSHPARPWTSRHTVWLVANGVPHEVPYRP